MLAILIIAIYLTGCVKAYLIFRKTEKKDSGEWTQADRSAGIGFALFSWLTYIFFYLLSDECDKPAKW